VRIAFIGLGEAASAFLSGWGPDVAGSVTAYDIKTANGATAQEIADRAAHLGIRNCATPDEALADAQLVFSTVTADQAEIAAEAYALFLEAGAIWCDLNSCAPETKRRAHRLIAAAGGVYLDVAVMSPVHPKLNMVPCLVSGARAEELAPTLAALPMDVRVVGDAVGRASSIKMVRSIMVKGLEALTAECTLAAVAAGVGGEVFPSLKSGAPHLDVPERAAYNFERSIVHGKRRAAEMDEVARMLGDLGLPNDMALATSAWQQRLAQSGVEIPGGGTPPDHEWFARAILEVLGDAPD